MWSKIKRHKNSILVCVIVLLLSYGYHYIYSERMESQLEEMRVQLLMKEETIRLNYKTIEDQAETISELQKEGIARSKELLDIAGELSFWRESAVIVTRTGEKYHTYGCQYIRGRDIWIYNIEAAEGRGYEPCSVCHPG